MNIFIDGTGISSKGYKVFLDGVDYSSNIKSLTISIDAHGTNNAKIEFVRVELSAELEALIMLAEKEKENEIDNNG